MENVWKSKHMIIIHLQSSLKNLFRPSVSNPTYSILIILTFLTLTLRVMYHRFIYYTFIIISRENWEFQRDHDRFI